MGARRESVLDTEALFLKIDSLLDSGSPMTEAMTESFQSIEGTASVCFFDAPSQLMCLATNNGSIYFWFDSNSEMLIFASESYILKCILVCWRRRLRCCNWLGRGTSDDAQQQGDAEKVFISFQGRCHRVRSLLFLSYPSGSRYGLSNEGNLDRRMPAHAVTCPSFSRS